MSPPAQNLPPVTVLCGFLGAGKTTLLRHLLGQAAGKKWAAIVNDVAALNIDAQLVAEAGAGKVIGLGNGCVCCSVRDELAETIAELAATGSYDHIFVETTGVAEPRAIANLFIRRNAFGRNLAAFAQLQALVTVVDAPAFLAQWAARPAEPPPGRIKAPLELMVEQVETADVLVLNKCDGVDAAGLARLEGILRGLNARAEIFRTEQGQLPAEVLLDRRRFDAQETLRAARWIQVLGGGAARPAVSPYLEAGQRPALPHEQDYGITSFVYEARRPFAQEKFLGMLRAGLPPELLRAKGFLWLQERPDDIGFLSIAGGQVRHDFIGTWVAALRERGVITAAEIPEAARTKWQEPHGDRRQELVFIGAGMDEPALRAALDGALLA
ncbi:MAG: GTP-binding protein [Opitutaceae bacterium]|nr:GTP-binding protein [Opitutaceae bacterium]MBP9911848.1 GTP-binding protein [Opitutaceae bacterium]